MKCIPASSVSPFACFKVAVSLFAAALLGLIPAFPAAAQTAAGAWVYPSATGNLLYQLDSRGQRIPDFSQCGYRGGTEPLPQVNALIPQDRWVYLNPGATDDTALIQAAINTVAALPLDVAGWRGVVFLNEGEYQLAGTLNLTASGVVLKGAGDSPTTGTRLRATDARQYTLISVRGSGSRSIVAGTTRNLTQKLVPAGTRTFEVDSTSGLAVGHTVLVKRPSTANWIADMDMDQLGPAPVVPWTAGSKDLSFDRTITRIEGNWITVDVPLPQTFELIYGGGQIQRYTWSGRIQQVGIEDLYGFSDYANPTDEAHAWNFIGMGNVQHSWVRNITAQYFGYAAVSVGDGAKWLTVADSQCLDPISLIDGGRRYSFNNDGAECTLFVNNYARKGRHDFVFGATVPGPNAFVHGTADTVYSDAGPHHRWSVGGLFDLITINGNEINIQNRGNSGTGHGWAGAYMAVWNCRASTFRVRNPPTARNWLIGSTGNIGASAFPVGADPPGTYDSSGPTGTGKAVNPRSLYYGQLQQRLKWPVPEFREVWLGDVDQHTSTGGSGEVVPCDPAWLAQVEALGEPPAGAAFDLLTGNRYTACTLEFPLDPGDTIVAASLTVSLRGIGSAAADSLWLDSTGSPQTYASLGWTPISTTAPAVRTMEVSPALLADGRLNLAFGLNTAVDFATLHLQVQKVQRSTTTVTLAPEADAYVQGGTNANTNYGTATALLTKEDSSPDAARGTYLRWDLSSVSGKIVQAKVRFTVASSGQTGNENAAHFVSDDTWAENAITFANKPAPGKLFAPWLPVTGQAVEFTVTPQVMETITGDGKLSLSILSTANHGANGLVNYASREHPTAASRPQLILTLENPPAPGVKAATGSVLNNGSAWEAGFVPADPDTATWNATSLTGTMTLGADLNWGGLILNNPAAPLTFNGSQSLALGSAGIDLSASTVDLSLNHPVFLADNQTWNTGAGRVLTANGPVSGAGFLTKSGAGTLVLSGTARYSGTTTLDQGTLRMITASPSLPGGLQFGSSAANSTPGLLDLTSVSATFGGPLTVSTNSATPGAITIGPGRILTINGSVQIGVTAPAVTSTSNLTLSGGGTFRAVSPAAGSFVVGGANGTTARQDATLDLTALQAATINTGTAGTLRVGPSTNNSNGRGTLLLPAPPVADTVPTTTLTAATLAVGNGSSGGGSVNQLLLGTGLTRLHADSITVGTGGRDVGRISFSQAAGDLILRAADGTSRATVIHVASLNGATANPQTSSVDFSGHDADILAATLNVGNQPRANHMTTAFNFGQGDSPPASRLDVTNVNISHRPQNTNTTTATHTARVNLSGGTVIFGHASGTGTGVDMGNNAYFGSGTSSGSTVAELNVSGGQVTIHHSASLAAAVRLGTNVESGMATVTASLNLTGGTTSLGGDLIRNVTSPRTTSTVRISGGALDMGGHDIGTAAAPVTLTVESGTLQNVNSINGTSGLTKTSPGLLTLNGINAYPGATTVSSGTLALTGSLAGAMIVNHGGLFAPQGLPAVAGALSLNAGSTYRTRLNGPTAGAQYDQATAAGTVSLGGALEVIAAPGLGPGSSFRILNKSSAGPISGTFTGKPEGSVFTGDGYPWIISYLGGDGNDAVLTLASPLQAWRYAFFGTTANTGTAADTSDPNQDGEVNFLEYATGQHPQTNVRAVATLLPAGPDLWFTYTRATSAVSAGVTFAVQWSDSPAAGWRSTGVTEQVLGDNGTVQTVQATVPAGTGSRFCRLKVTLTFP